MNGEERVLRKSDLRKKVRLSDATIWRREHEGDFPKRLNLGGAAVGWLESEVDAWLQKKAAERVAACV
jgi:prophage regulatory protein